MYIFVSRNWTKQENESELKVENKKEVIAFQRCQESVRLKERHRGVQCLQEEWWWFRLLAPAANSRLKSTARPFTDVPSKQQIPQISPPVFLSWFHFDSQTCTTSRIFLKAHLCPTTSVTQPVVDSDLTLSFSSYLCDFLLANSFHVYVNPNF